MIKKLLVQDLELRNDLICRLRALFPFQGAISGELLEDGGHLYHVSLLVKALLAILIEDLIG